MEKFWKWLMRADAKALFAVTTLVGLGVVMWVGYHGFRREPARATQSLAPRDALSLDLLSFVDQQLRVDASWFPTTPFRPSAGRRVMPARPTNGADVTFVPSDPSDPAVPADPGLLRGPVRVPTRSTRRPRRGRPPRRPPPAGPAQPAPVVLSYHGVLERSDGVSLALVADSSQQGRRFYSVGDDLAGMRVTRVGSDFLWLRDTKGELLRLASGRPVTCLDGRQVESMESDEVLP
jgi:hypothetical protein